MPLPGVPNIPGLDFGGNGSGYDLSSHSSTGPAQAGPAGGAFAIGGVGSTSGNATGSPGNKTGGLSTTEMLIFGGLSALVLVVALRR